MAVIEALIPKPSNSLIWIPIPDPSDGLQDMVDVLRKSGGCTGQILNANYAPIEVKTSLPFAYEWDPTSPLSAPSCLLPHEIVYVHPEGLGPVPTHGDLRTWIFPTKHINIILPRFIEF